jgi:hypothetical protein
VFLSSAFNHDAASGGAGAAVADQRLCDGDAGKAEGRRLRSRFWLLLGFVVAHGCLDAMGQIIGHRRRAL